jgi:hypothetical protein
MPFFGMRVISSETEAVCGIMSLLRWRCVTLRYSIDRTDSICNFNLLSFSVGASVNIPEKVDNASAKSLSPITAEQFASKFSM